MTAVFFASGNSGPRGPRRRLRRERRCRADRDARLDRGGGSRPGECGERVRAAVRRMDPLNACQRMRSFCRMARRFMQATFALTGRPIAPLKLRAADTLQWSGFALLRGASAPDGVPLRTSPCRAQAQLGIDWRPAPFFGAHVHLLARSEDDDARRGHARRRRGVSRTELHEPPAHHGRRVLPPDVARERRRAVGVAVLDHAVRAEQLDGRGVSADRHRCGVHVAAS